MKDKIKAWASATWTAVKSAPAVFGYGIAVGYMLNWIL